MRQFWPRAAPALGDYEDPDRTAWPTCEEEVEESEDHRDKTRGEATEEFPVEG